MKLVSPPTNSHTRIPLGGGNPQRVARAIERLERREHLEHIKVIRQRAELIITLLDEVSLNNTQLGDSDSEHLNCRLETLLDQLEALGRMLGDLNEPNY